MSNPLELLFAQMGNGEERPMPARPLPEAQLMELRDRWVRYNEPSTIKPGDLVREKAGMGMFLPERRDYIALMLWRMLDLTCHHDQEMANDWLRKIKCNRVDCVVAYVADNGSTLIFELRELAQLEPWTHDEGQPT